MAVSASDCLGYLVVRTAEILSDGTVSTSSMRLEDTPANREMLRRQGLRVLPDPGLGKLGQHVLKARDRRRAQSN